MVRYVSLAMVVAAAVAMARGCQYPGSRATRLDPDSSDTLGGTGIDSVDVRSVAQEMARAILDVKSIRGATVPPRILILPVKNRTRFRMETDVFTVLIRDLLIENAGERVVFLDRDAPGLPRAKPLEGVAEHTKGFSPEQLGGVQFFLKGELYSISKGSPRGVSDWIVYSFQLVDIKSSDIVWSKSYETKKEGIPGIVYR